MAFYIKVLLCWDGGIIVNRLINQRGVLSWMMTERDWTVNNLTISYICTCQSLFHVDRPVDYSELDELYLFC